MVLILKIIRTVTERFIGFIKNPSRTEEINNGWDGLVVLDCHQAMVVNLTSDLPIPLGNGKAA